MNEKIKRWLKITGIVIGALLLYGVFNLFYGGISNKATYNFKEKPNELLQGVNLAKPSKIPAPGMGGTEMEDSMKLRSAADGGKNEFQDKRVIKNGNLSLKVAKTENAAKKISEIAKSKGGEVFSSRFYESIGGLKSGTITVKVPVDKFEETMEAIKKVATQVVSESTTGKDVTEQYADLQAQLKNKRAEEQAFVKILDRAGKIEDVLKVTKEISRVRGEIERLEGRIKYLESQTDMSTIAVSLSEDVEISPVGEGWRPWQSVKSSVKTLIKNTQSCIDSLIYFIIVKIPSIAAFLLILWIIYWIGKKIYRKIRT